MVPAHIVENFALLKDDYVKSDACRECSRNAICDGVHKSYGNFIGTEELKAVSGDGLLHPMHFRSNYTSQWR